MKVSRIIRRSLTGILAAAMLTVGGAALGDGTDTEDDTADTVWGITTASSGIEDISATLKAKIPEFDGSAVIGTADSASLYGIDMSDFEDDGYIIKTAGDTTLIFGKTEYGLTTAANRFANMYKADSVQDVSFHEGYRIGTLKVFGTDISEYVIEYPADANENMAFAVSELQQLVKKATGVALSAVEGDSGSAHVIEFRHTTDSALGNDGYRYFDENGTLVLEGAVARGCMNAVYRFLQNECGWDELIGGDSVLREADVIDIPAGIDKSETPAFDYLFIHNQIWDTFKTDRSSISYNSVKNSYGAPSNACHGILRFLDDPSAGWQDQPCFTSEETYESVSLRVREYIEEQIAAGKTPGLDLIEIDIAQTDSNVYCKCDECMRVFEEEGNAHSGAVVRFANRLSEELNETYPGIIYKIFAYANSNIPCKTAPNDLVYVTYCFDMNCSNHPLDASECGDGETCYGRKNSDYAKWLEGWCDLTDNVYVWFYSLDTNFHDYTVIDTIYKDFTYLHELGVRGVFWQSTNHGLGMKRIDHQLGYNLNWNIDMTEEEYMDMYHRLLEKEFGAGWEYVREYIDIMNDAQDRMGCWQCWGWSYARLVPDAYYDTIYYASQYDYIVEIMDRAIAMAESPENIKRCEMFIISALYKGCYSEYFKAYEENDTERIAVLSERFDRAMALMKKYGFDLSGEEGRYMSIDGYVMKFRHASIEDAAWIDWQPCRESLCPGFTREVPENYPTILPQ